MLPGAIHVRHELRILVTAAAEAATKGRLAELRQQLGIPLIAKPFDMEEVLVAVAKAARELTGGSH